MKDAEVETRTAIAETLKMTKRAGFLGVLAQQDQNDLEHWLFSYRQLLDSHSKLRQAVGVEQARQSARFHVLTSSLLAVAAAVLPVEPGILLLLVRQYQALAAARSAATESFNKL